MDDIGVAAAGTNKWAVEAWGANLADNTNYYQVAFDAPPVLPIQPNRPAFLGAPANLRPHTRE